MSKLKRPENYSKVQRARPVFGEARTYLPHPEHEKNLRKSARVIRVLRPRLRAWASGCGTPTPKSKLAKLELRAPIFAGFFPIRTEAPPSMLGWDYRGQGGRAGVMSNNYNLCVFSCRCAVLPLRRSSLDGQYINVAPPLLQETSPRSGPGAPCPRPFWPHCPRYGRACWPRPLHRASVREAGRPHRRGVPPPCW